MACSCSWKFSIFLLFVATLGFVMNSTSRFDLHFKEVEWLVAALGNFQFFLWFVATLGFLMDSQRPNSTVRPL